MKHAPVYKSLPGWCEAWPWFPCHQVGSKPNPVSIDGNQSSGVYGQSQSNSSQFDKYSLELAPPSPPASVSLSSRKGHSFSRERRQRPVLRPGLATALHAAGTWRGPRQLALRSSGNICTPGHDPAPSPCRVQPDFRGRLYRWGLRQKSQ